MAGAVGHSGVCHRAGGVAFATLVRRVDCVTLVDACTGRRLEKGVRRSKVEHGGKRAAASTMLRGDATGDSDDESSSSSRCSPRSAHEKWIPEVYAREIEYEERMVVELMRRSEVRERCCSRGRIQRQEYTDQLTVAQFALNEIMYKPARQVKPTATSEGLVLPPGISENQSFLEYFLFQHERVISLVPPVAAASLRPLLAFNRLVLLRL